MTDLRFMEDINNILYSGEVPNIFAIDEKQEIIENMRMLEKELDKSQHTDGSGPGNASMKIRLREHVATNLNIY